MTNFEKMAVELLQIPYSNQPLREAQMDKMYSDWRGENFQLYQLPYRLDFWGKLFSKNLTARGLLHNIPQEELREFFMNNLYDSKMMKGYVQLQSEHKHGIRKSKSGQWLEIYEHKLGADDAIVGRVLTQFKSSLDGLSYTIWGRDKFFTSLPALQTFIIQSHFATYENISKK